MVNVVKPEVRRLANPCIDVDFPDLEVGETGSLQLAGMEISSYSTDSEDLIEFAGRACYQSFHKPNPKTAENADYIANIIAQGHESVLEHATVTFYLTGVSRALTHELIRHRHLSYSQMSQRFVDESEANIVMPPAISALYHEGSKEYEAVVKSARKSLKKYTALVESLQNEGLPRKQAREAARAVLPNCLETRIVVSGNLRAWRDYLKKRISPHADAEIRIVSQMILAELYDVAPSVFKDFVE
ncbi:FAD-dependent thymidylate synthase [Corynebacterium guaraldiae]|uniref:FAD-dependent thymidylate synthase n=1 Tax=Corynebacterium guaraldiae TaxID=3051103 RepID=UPI001178C6C0|nr:FAD-dependent thymidylate synthase [Corynebacterium guaraldiae]TRX43708.1 FAD-dependent thymidylate synthase [Corynebacterium guaraldiae]